MPFPLENDALMRLHFDAALMRSMQMSGELVKAQIALALQVSDRRVDGIFQLWWAMATHAGTDHSREFTLHQGQSVEVEQRTHGIDFSVIWKRMDFPWVPIEIGVQIHSDAQLDPTDFVARRGADMERQRRNRAAKAISDVGWEIFQFEEARVLEDAESCVKEVLFAAEVRVSEVLRPRERGERSTP